MQCCLLLHYLSCVVIEIIFELCARYPLFNFILLGRARFRVLESRVRLLIFFDFRLLSNMVQLIFVCCGRDSLRRTPNVKTRKELSSKLQ